jgi:8-oxo-dGTP pyrophosphatase MutT (NUDIX family)
MTAFYQRAADARAAASLLLLRDGAGGLEVLMLRRAERDGDMRSGAVVFPGGVLDAGDRDAHRWCLGPGDAEASARLGVAEGGLDYLVAAVREAFEEVGLLLAARPDGSAFDAAAMADALQPWRRRLHAGEASIGDFCTAFDLRLDLRSLAYTSHWLTPPGLPKRFDTRFFQRARTGQPDRGGRWQRGARTDVADTARRAGPARGLKLLPVTQRTLQQLGAFADARAAFAQRRRSATSRS